MPTPPKSLIADRPVFARGGLLALEQSALGMLWPTPGSPSDPYLVAAGAAAVVDIRGPLAHAEGTSEGESYASIKARVASALETSAPTIVLRVSSPGGDVYGAFDAARAIRAMAAAAGKRLIAYSDGQVASAAYALASAASEIVVSDTATVGSIGVMLVSVDASKAEEAIGLRFSVIASGGRKADSNPHTPMTPDALASLQAQVDEQARVFCELVAEHRGLDPEAVAGLEAGVFVGAQAVAAGLADRVAPWESFLGGVEFLAAGGIGPSETTRSPHDGAEMDHDEEAKGKAQDDEEKPDAVRAALAKAAESDDEEKAARARRALQAYDAKAEDDEEGAKGKGKAEDDEEEAKATAAAASATAASLAQTVESQGREIASLKAKNIAAERAAIFGARPDLSKATISALKDAPIAMVRSVVDSIAKAPGSASVDTQAGANATRGGAPGVAGVSSNPTLDAQMGLVETKATVKHDGVITQLGVRIPAEGSDR